MYTRHRIFLVFIFIMTLHPHLRAQWTKTSGPDGTITCFAASGSYLFAGSDIGIYVTTDNGAFWKIVTPPSLNYNTTALRFSGGKLYAGVFGRGILVSTNYGTTWTAMNAGLTNSSIMDLAVDRDYLYVATRDAGIFRSSDQGNSWSSINNGLQGTWIRAIVASGPDVFAGTRYNGVVHSTDYGETWAECNTGLTITSFFGLALRGTTIFAGGFGGAFCSTNNGASWNDLNTSGLVGAYVYDFAFTGSNIVAGTDMGAYLSTNNGGSWTSFNTGLPDSTLCYGFIIYGDHIYTGSYRNKAWKRPLSDVIASAEHNPAESSTECTLDGNYPNPVRSSTRISFRLAARSLVRLNVHDIYGRVVAELACEELPAGQHTREWSADRMRTGTYFIRLQVGSAIKSTRVVVVL